MVVLGLTGTEIVTWLVLFWLALDLGEDSWVYPLAQVLSEMLIGVGLVCMVTGGVSVVIGLVLVLRERPGGVWLIACGLIAAIVGFFGAMSGALDWIEGPWFV